MTKIEIFILGCLLVELMKCVIDTSPVIWLRKIGMEDLPFQIYETCYTTPSVNKELRRLQVSDAYIDKLVVPESVRREAKRFDKLTRRWKRRFESEDTADVEVFVTYKFYSDAGEMLFANKDAQEKIRRRKGIVRDLSHIFELAEEREIFSREQSKHYLQKLLSVEFRIPYVQTLLARL